ncbi:ankyrin repeat-containing domain protein [Podospora australis]|uniref:Ankyrin repeat-containing domain protein n=1 Tax=Podospora australis TaxID=1536484 RepID=A0AAN6WXU0_9PEZI|nr:ankyrin repeat-containing domain protein [Podospora australis]
MTGTEPPRKKSGNRLRRLSAKQRKGLTLTASNNASRGKAKPGVPIGLLPPEIVLMILELLSASDQLVLARVNKWFNAIITPEIYSKNVRLDNASCIFWGAEFGQLGTLKHALAAGANLDAVGPVNYKTKLGSSESDDDDNEDRSVSDDNGDDGDDGDDQADGDDDDGDANNGNSSRPAQLIDPTPIPDSKLLPYTTPLHLAAKRGHRDVVAWLLDNGVDINAHSFRVCECQALKHERNPLRRVAEWPRWRALHTAMCHGERVVAELLIHRGASLSLDAAPEHHHTALHSAAANGLVPIIKLLAINDVDLDANQRDRWDNTALHYVGELYRIRDSATVRDTITKLLALGADLEAYNERGHTPLLNACFRGNFAVAHRFASIGANTDPHKYIRKFREVRPLFYAVLPRSDFYDLDDAPVRHDEFEGNRVALIKALVEAGARVDARFDKRNHREATALMLACELAEPRAVATLVQCGASVNLQDRSGRTALYYACCIRVDHRSEVGEIAGILLSAGARMDMEEEPMSCPLDWAVMQIRWADENVLLAMLKAATEQNVSELKLKTALKRSAASGNHKAIRMLLPFTEQYYRITNRDVKSYLDANIDRSDPWNQVETLNCILDWGRSVYTNETLLLKSMVMRNRELCLAMLKRFVSVSDPRCYGGQTFLHLACQWGEIEVVKELVDRGAELNVFDKDLKTPLMLAVTQDHGEVAVFLMKEVADPYLEPPDYLLEKFFEDEDERRFVRKRFLTAFDIAIQENRLSIVKDMLNRFNLPEIRHPKEKNCKNTYLHRACRNPNPKILNMLLERKFDNDAALDCVMSILRDVWTGKIRLEIASNPLNCAKLLDDQITTRNQEYWSLLEQIAFYEGAELEKLEAQEKIMREMRFEVTYCPNRPSQKMVVSMPDLTDAEMMKLGYTIPYD